MKRKLISFGIMLGVFIGGMSPTALAAETTTKGGIVFDKDTSANITAVDPLQPSKTIKTDKPAVIGDYSIIYTSDYQFGSHKLTSGDATFYAKNPIVSHMDGNTNEVPNFVEVLDRSGSTNGWRLTAAFAKALQNQTGDSIKGATITFDNIHVASTDGFDEKLIQLSKQATINSDTQEAVMVAEDAQGQTSGFWIVTFGNSAETGKNSVKLFVPNTEMVKAGTYSTSVTWTFEAAL